MVELQNITPPPAPVGDVGLELTEGGDKEAVSLFSGLLIGVFQGI